MAFVRWDHTREPTVQEVTMSRSAGGCTTLMNTYLTALLLSLSCVAADCRQFSYPPASMDHTPSFYYPPLSLLPVFWR